MKEHGKNRGKQGLFQSTPTTLSRQTPNQQSRLSYFAPLGRQTTSSLSQQVWEESHPKGEGRTYPFEQTFVPKSRSSDTYRLQLLKNIETEGGGDHLWDPYNIITSSESNSLSGSLSSSDLRIKYNPERKRFTSLRGLPRFSVYPRQLKTPDTVVKYKAEFSPDRDSGVDHFSNVFLTLESLEELSLNEIKSESLTREIVEYDCLINTASRGISKINMTTKELRSSQKADTGNRRDNSTSPYGIKEGKFNNHQFDVFKTSIRNKTEMKRTSFTTPHTPYYPYEVRASSKQTRRRLNRMTTHGGQLRSSRNHDYSYPSVISSTHQLLCLTPSKGGVITMGVEEDEKSFPTHPVGDDMSHKIKVKRFNENDQSSSIPFTAAVLAKTNPNVPGRQGNAFFRIMQQNSVRPRTSPGSEKVAFSLAQLHYKNSTHAGKPYRYPSLSPTVTGARASGLSSPHERNATSMSVTKNPANTAYRIIENHVKGNRKWPIFQTHRDDVGNVYPYQSSFMVQNNVNQARKMAPVLRVIPALPRAPKEEERKKVPKSITDTEGASQKKVRFSDQIGLPLVRNATPNYRRKHSYILRWLETAGKPVKTVPLV